MKNSKFRLAKLSPLTAFCWIGNGDDVKIGAPVVDGAKVTAEVVAQGRHDKVTIIKFRRRKHHMKRQGHRQWFTEVKITGIQG